MAKAISPILHDGELIEVGADVSYLPQEALATLMNAGVVDIDVPVVVVEEEEAPAPKTKAKGK